MKGRHGVEQSNGRTQEGTANELGAKIGIISIAVMEANSRPYQIHSVFRFFVTNHWTNETTTKTTVETTQNPSATLLSVH